jgi:peptidoglycan hydrolase-like protein with peptidoglycan-binding domain
MGTVAGMLAHSRLMLGTTEHPPGSNHNEITAEFGFDGPWCNMAVSIAAAHSDNLAAVFGKFAWTVGHARTFVRHGRWHHGLGGARPGDVVFFDWGGSRAIENIDHVGVVEAVHGDGTITTLEGNTSDAFLRRVRNGAVVVGYGRPAYDDAAPLPDGDGKLRLGSTGEPVRTLQRRLNAVLGAGLAVDGEFGPATERALKAFQAGAHIEADGEYGPQSAARLAAAVAGRSASKVPTPLPPAAVPLEVDGTFGPGTCAALQRALNGHGAQLTVDGALGPQTKRALQKLLGVADDGVLGPQTVRALQRRVGAEQDGSWGAETTRRLQSALNAGTF